ncbi:hypothetical protein Bca101_047170 [Brassica carinata]
MSLTELDDGLVRSMAIGAVFSDFGGKIRSVGFHRTDDLLVTSSEDDSLRLFDIANANSFICSSLYNLESTGGNDDSSFSLTLLEIGVNTFSWICIFHVPESLRYLSMYDNRILRYFKGHKDRVVSLCMSPINDSFMSGSLDRSVRLWDLRVNACQGILHLRGRPAVAYDQQGLVFAIAMEGGAVKLFDSRCYDKGPFDTFLVGGDTAEVNDIKFSNDGKSMLLTTTNNNIYVLDAYHGEKKCGFSLEPSQGTSLEATFTPDGKYVLSGSGDGTLHAWNIENPSEKVVAIVFLFAIILVTVSKLSLKKQVARWENNIGVVSCLKWAPRRAMFVAASTVLTFWIPNDGEAPAPADHSADQQPPQ